MMVGNQPTSKSHTQSTGFSLFFFSISGGVIHFSLPGNSMWTLYRNYIYNRLSKFIKCSPFDPFVSSVYSKVITFACVSVITYVSSVITYVCLLPRYIN